MFCLQRSDNNEIWRLLNWILHLVVNSDSREKYIASIMRMKPEVTVDQVVIYLVLLRLELTIMKDQMYIMQLLQAPEDFAVVEATENDENRSDQTEVLQEIED